MLKKLPITLAMLAVLVSACATKDAGRTPTISPQSTPQATAQARASTVPAGSECTLVSAMPTPGPTEVSLFPPVTEEDWTLGPATAEVTILEYSDFQ